VLRIWDGDYVRIRGYRRELNHLIFSKMRKIKQKDFDKYNDFPIKNFNFIEEAEKLILRNGENIASELVILESLRYLDRACEIKHKPYINFLLLKLLGK
jgi:hypothetical protein